MQSNSHILMLAFFPPSIPFVEKYCNLMLEDIPLIDILGSWIRNEKKLKSELQNCHKIYLHNLETFFAANPLTVALQNKKVLVVHPFVDKLKEQYLKRKLIFKNNLLPDFELKTLRAVQSITGQKNEFADWFSELNFYEG